MPLCSSTSSTLLRHLPLVLSTELRHDGVRAPARSRPRVPLQETLRSRLLKRSQPHPSEGCIVRSLAVYFKIAPPLPWLASVFVGRDASPLPSFGKTVRGRGVVELLSQGHCDRQPLVFWPHERSRHSLRRRAAPKPDWHDHLFKSKEGRNHKHVCNPELRTTVWCVWCGACVSCGCVWCVWCVLF